MSQPEVEVALVVSPRDWADRLHRFAADHGGARVRARPLDAQQALDERYEVLVVDDTTSFLTPRLVEELHRSGRRLLGVHDASEPAGRRRLLDLGADDVLPATAEPDEFLRVLEVLGAGGGARRSGEAQPVGALDGPGPSGDELPPPPRVGAIVAVGGPAGGVGATEVAVALGGHLQRTASTVLVDLDVTAPSLAQRLGTSLHPNVRTGIDLVEHRAGRPDEVLLDVAGGPAVLPGLPSAAGWEELRPDGTIALLHSLAASRRWVVADVGHGIEDLATPAGVGRYAVPRTVLAEADLIVGIGAPTPVGVARLLAWVAELRSIAPSTPLLVAVNRTPGSRFSRAELEAEIVRSLDVPALGFLPDDRRVPEAAWDGRLVTGGGFVRAVGSLAEALRSQQLTGRAA